jgi:hypothetical protein
MISTDQHFVQPTATAKGSNFLFSLAHATRIAAAMIFPLLLLVPALSAAVPNDSSSAFVEQIHTHFAQWDLDHNGELSTGEIEQAVANPAVSGKAAAAVVALRRAVRGRTYDLPSLTEEHIAEIASHDGNHGEKLPDFGGLYAAALDRIEKANRQLFGPDGPTLDALHQGRLGDCFCLAPLGAMVHRNPQDVVKMFHREDDGGFTVTFGGKESVRVPPLTDGEIAVTASTRDEGMWIGLYEKAVGIYRARTMANDDRPTALSVVAKGGSAGTMLEFLIGRPIRRFSCQPWRDPAVDGPTKTKLLAELRDLLSDTVRNRRLICGGTGGGIKVPGVLGLHAYAILNYDADKDEVLLWNPIGNGFKPQGPAGLENGYPTTNGQFRVPLTELLQFFGGFSFETADDVRS